MKPPLVITGLGMPLINQYVSARMVITGLSWRGSSLPLILGTTLKFPPFVQRSDDSRFATG